MTSILGVSSMEYLGNVLTDEGLQVHCASAKTKGPVRASPLWDLTKSHAKWKWGTAEEKAFKAVKMQLTQAPFMAFFKQGAETRVTTDPSPAGMGAVLEQKQDDGLYRPVHYAC